MTKEQKPKAPPKPKKPDPYAARMDSLETSINLLRSVVESTSRIAVRSAGEIEEIKHDLSGCDDCGAESRIPYLEIAQLHSSVKLINDEIKSIKSSVEQVNEACARNEGDITSCDCRVGSLTVRHDFLQEEVTYAHRRIEPIEKKAESIEARLNSIVDQSFARRTI